MQASARVGDVCIETFEDLMKSRIQNFKHAGPVNSVCFSPDGKRIVSGCHDKFARIFDVGSGKEIIMT